jgi:hypothetical protein
MLARCSLVWTTFGVVIFRYSFPEILQVRLIILPSLRIPICITLRFELAINSENFRLINESFEHNIYESLEAIGTEYMSSMDNHFCPYILCMYHTENHRAESCTKVEETIRDVYSVYDRSIILEPDIPNPNKLSTLCGHQITCRSSSKTIEKEI